MSTINGIPTEVLDCIAAHLLAVEWLADEVQDLGPWAELSRDELIAEARRQGFNRYRDTPPEGIAAIAAQALAAYKLAAQALETYRAIADEDSK
ncbi:hypothetical protein [Leptolyngbya sp. KIOST-1]|uniref:hypothetical protein n=1 Tax=Leptolyngbya sp. KIOST-1 TaxID=1229172 RepID=UPI0005661EE8|nr:hypothetical protein [Leptolyngbya sp. KIOST-1]